MLLLPVNRSWRRSFTVRKFSRRTTADCAGGGPCRRKRRRWHRQPCRRRWGCASSRSCRARRRQYRRPPATWWRPAAAAARRRLPRLLTLPTAERPGHRAGCRCCSSPSWLTRTVALTASYWTSASLLTQTERRFSHLRYPNDGIAPVTTQNAFDCPLCIICLHSVWRNWNLACSLYSYISLYSLYSKGENRLRRPSVDVDAVATSTACCDPDLWFLTSII